VSDDAGNFIQPTDPGYDAARVRWYAAMLEDCYRFGRAGSNVGSGRAAGVAGALRSRTGHPARPGHPVGSSRRTWTP
jgi:hypothetical protein